MRDIRLRFSIDRSTCQRSHLSLVFCECLQVFIHKGDTDLAYEISPMYRESQLLCAEIVAHKNEQAPAIRRLARLADVEAAVPAVLSHGVFFFIDIEQHQVDT